MLLQAGDDIEKIRRSRIALGAEHLVERLYVDAGLLSEQGKAYGRIDEVAQNLSPQRRFARQQGIDGVV